MVGLAAFARYFVLQSSLLLLQIGDEGAFLFLLRLQFSLFGFTLLQQTFLGLLHLFQFGLLGSNLLLLFLNFFALQTLVGGILAHVTQTAVGLCQVFGREDEHQLFFNRTVLVQVTHGSGILLALLLKLTAQRSELAIERGEFLLDGFHVAVDAEDVAFPFFYLSGQCGKAVQLAAHGFLGRLQQGFGLGNLFLQIATLVFQLLDQFVRLSQKRRCTGAQEEEKNQYSRHFGNG